MSGKQSKRKRIEKGIFIIDGSWTIQYSVNGKQVRERVGEEKSLTKTMVRDILAKRKTDVQSGKIESNFGVKFAKKSASIEKSFEAYLEYSRNNKLSYKIDELSIKRLRKTFKTVKDLNHLSFERYKKERMTEGVAYRSVDIELQSLNSSMKYGVECHLLPEKFLNIKAKLFRKDNKKTDFLSEEEIDAVLNACEEFEYIETFVRVALLQGFRKSEVLGLRWEDVDFKNERITLLKTKTNKMPTTYILHTELKHYLQKLQEHFQETTSMHLQEINTLEKKRSRTQKESKRLSLLRNEAKRFQSEYIITLTGKRMTDVKISWTSLLQKAGLRHYRIHDLRHTYASHQLMNGATLHDLLQTGLWRNIQSLLRYGHLEEKNLKEKLNRFSIRKKREIFEMDFKLARN